MASSKASAGDAIRLERDTMGEMPVPADALYGATTQRAVLNFPVSGRPVPVEVIEAFADFVAGLAKGETVGPTFKDAQVTQQVCESVLASGKDGTWHDVAE